MRKLYGRLSAWADRPLGMGAFLAMVAFAGICCVAIGLVCQIYDSDMYFLLATGRETVFNGIVRENRWAVDDGLGFVAQQWLYNVLLYFVERFGHAGFTAFVGAQFVAFVVVLMSMFRSAGMGKGLSWLCIAVAVTFSQSYVFCIRPQLVTLVLLGWECLCIERYSRDGRARHLVGLPVGMVLEMNLHASMWPFHFCIVLAYLVPTFWLPGSDNGTCRGIVREKWRPFLAAVLAMLPAILVNPYGVDGAMYVFRSYLGHTFSLVKVTEMVPATILSGPGVMIIVCGCLAFVCHRLGCLSGHSVNMLLGFGVLSAVAVRNHMFMVFPLAFLLRDLCRGIGKLDFTIDWKKDVRNYLIPILLGVDLLFGLAFLSSARNVFVDEGGQVSTLGAAVDYIRARSDADTRVFAGFNVGAYLEYEGFYNVYLDARPELYMKSLNGKKNVLAEYSRYCIYGASTYVGKDDVGSVLEFPVTRDEMLDWFEEYDFQFVCVTPRLECHLAGFMAANGNYALVEELSGPDMLLYERICRP